MTQLRATDRQDLIRLEESLWRAETRFDRAHMERVLHPDFFEFGRSGRIYSRTDTLGAPARAIDAKLPMRDLAVHVINADVALVTYIDEVRDRDLQVANRSSLWTRRDGTWTLRFHQGTPASCR